MSIGLDSATLLAFFATGTALNISPGPAVLRTISDAIQHGPARAHGTIFGILAANAVYCGLAVLGLGAVLLAIPSIFVVVKWLGVAYLVYLALHSLISAFKAGAATKMPDSVPASKLFLRSFLLQAGNPKSFLFFLALLPLFAGDAEGAPLRIAVLGLLDILSEYPVLLAYALLGGKVLALARTKTAQRITEAAGSFALFGAATMVARASLKFR